MTLINQQIAYEYCDRMWNVGSHLPIPGASLTKEALVKMDAVFCVLCKAYSLSGLNEG